MKQKIISFILALALMLSFVPSVSAIAAPAKDYSPVFDANYYAAHNPDLVAAYKNDAGKLLNHFIKYGMRELRQGSASFDVLSYKRAYPDLRKAYGNDIVSYYNHYLDIGRKEGRNQVIGVNTISNPTKNYHGIDLSTVYDYHYYINHYPDLYALFNADDEAAIDHFMRHGIREGRTAIDNPDLTMLARLRPISSGIANEVSSYQGIDLSPVYNYAYYMFNNPDVAADTNYDPSKACEHFVSFGMNEDRKGLPSYDLGVYENIRNIVKAPADTIRQMALEANKYASDTQYIIMTNKSAMRVAVFKGSKGNYSLVKDFPCAIGASTSPTPSGVYKVGSKGLYFDTGTAGRCWYYTQIKGNYLFHSQIYDRSNKPLYLIDASMASAVSHGCIRLNIENAKWIYDTIPARSTIVIY